MITNQWFYPLNQSVCHDLKFNGIDLSWLHIFKHRQEVYYLINIKSDPTVLVPNGRDLYIFAWFFETFDDNWFMEIYHKNPQADFIVLTSMYPNGLSDLNRVKIFNLNHHVTWFQAIRQMNKGPSKAPLSTRKYKISSLSSRLSEFKFFITAKLLDRQDSDIMVTWNRGFEIRNVDDFIFNSSNYRYIDELITKFQGTLRSQKVNSQQWNNSPLDNCFFEHDAYQSTIVNCINETQSLSFTPEFGVLPLPYLTEKTWKPLFSGNALLFSTQAFAKKQLESFGFKFDYPWAHNFDEETHDLHRYNTVLAHIDWILSLDKETLAYLCRDSIEHNLELAWSRRLDQQIYQHNEQVMQQLKHHLGCV